MLPGPTPPTPPAHSEECQALIDTGIPECSSTDPPMTCGECWHNPTQDPKHCEKAPDCQTTPPPLPQPQCPTFTDRGGTLRCQSDACDCYCGQEFVECEVVPPPEECGFPQGIPNNKFTGVSNPGVYGSVVNRVCGGERLPDHLPSRCVDGPSVRGSLREGAQLRKAR